MCLSPDSMWICSVVPAVVLTLLSISTLGMTVILVMWFSTPLRVAAGALKRETTTLRSLVDRASACSSQSLAIATRCVGQLNHSSADIQCNSMTSRVQQQVIVICLFNLLFGSINTNSLISKLGDKTISEKHINIFLPYTIDRCFLHTIKLLYLLQFLSSGSNGWNMSKFAPIYDCWYSIK